MTTTTGPSGLFRGDNGEYYIALPCQQDQRSRRRGEAIAGKLLEAHCRETRHCRMIPATSSTSKSSPPATASRWAWPAIATGELFVTDNQGNYNPFNELNHVRPGAHFGFINALEKEQGFKPPPLDEPAIDIPHPWTRSVNGICFLDTPPDARSDSVEEHRANDRLRPARRPPRRLRVRHAAADSDVAAEGRRHVSRRGVSAEHSAGRRREGAARADRLRRLAATGELYVGEIRDSGWGAGNNIGQIVKIKIEPEKLPCGIAEVRATRERLHDRLLPAGRSQPRRADAANYSHRSPTAANRRRPMAARISTGGPRRSPRSKSRRTSKRVTLKLPELRERVRL